MQHRGFFERAEPFTLADVAKAVDGVAAAGADPDRLIHDVRALGEAGADDLSFIDNRKYLDALAGTSAGVCLVAPALVDRLPSATVAIVTKAPYRGFALALQLFYPDAMTSKAADFAADSAGPVHPSAQVHADAVIEPGAVIGREAQIGAGTRIAANAVIGYRVVIGRNSYVGAGAAITHALVGDGVIIHAGVRIGQDGFGFAMGREGHLKVPQIGRVVIHDDVEIGANSTVDRGALKDTIIGAGTKIDNLVQIGHNVVIGRHCVIVAQVGISGSTELGDFVVMGGQSGAVGHIKIGAGAQIAGASHPTGDVAPGARMGGTPARPLRQFGREIAMLTRLARAKPSSDSEQEPE
jgi:UDP-3-O-[3-hydroxymyristoyl] glucosamine N-acyltransferase